MNAQEARHLTNQTRQGMRAASYFDCLIAIRQACKEGHDSVIIAQSITADTAQKLVNDEYKLEDMSKKANEFLTKISW